MRALVVEIEGAVYYVDSVGGNDTNNGTTTNSAWQTLVKVNGTIFQPGDSILFKAGGSWIGPLHPNGSGISQQPPAKPEVADFARRNVPKISAVLPINFFGLQR